MKTPVTLTAMVVLPATLVLMAYAQQQSGQAAGSVGAERFTKAYEAGKAEATADIENGRLIHKTCGLPPRWHRTYLNILRTKYKVEVRLLGCIVTTELLENIRGYNEMSGAEIERRFGKGVLDRAAEDARKEYERVKRTPSRYRQHHVESPGGV